MQICWTVFPNYILQICVVWYFNFSTWFSMKALTLCSIPSQVNSYGRYGSICSQSQNTQFRRKSGHTSDFKQQTASVVRVFTLPLPLCAGGGGGVRGRMGESSRSLVDSGSPWITKHMRLCWLIWWIDPLFPVTRQRTSSEFVLNKFMRGSEDWTGSLTHAHSFSEMHF